MVYHINPAVSVHQVDATLARCFPCNKVLPPGCCSQSAVYLAVHIVQTAHERFMSLAVALQAVEEQAQQEAAAAAAAAAAKEAAARAAIAAAAASAAAAGGGPDAAVGKAADSAMDEERRKRLRQVRGLLFYLQFSLAAEHGREMVAWSTRHCMRKEYVRGIQCAHHVPTVAGAWMACTALRL